MSKSYESSVFRNNQSQAVRMPKALALPEHVKRVEIVAVGDARIITPAGASWDQWFDSPGVGEDFMNDRSQPAPQDRERLDG